MAATLSDKTMPTSAPASANGGAGNLESDIALLATLLAQPDVDESDPDVVELLRRLETADGVARGVEDRLDGIIGHLDRLLDDLEASVTVDNAQAAAAAVEGGEHGTTEGTAAETANGGKGS